MANITKRTNKKGELSYFIRVFVGNERTGKQIVKSMTYKPNPNYSESRAEKEAEKQAALFEEQVKSGLVAFDNKTTFEEYAIHYLETADIAPKTRLRYQQLLERINQAIGHIPLAKLQAKHLEVFYKNLQEEGIRKGAEKAAAKPSLSACIKKKFGTREAIAKAAGLSPTTITAACRGEKITVASAEAIAKVLGVDTNKLFHIATNSKPLSEQTVRHHHRLINAVLNKARKQRIIPLNVAQEVTPPRYRPKEAICLDDKQAQEIVRCLQNEEDIRIKTALLLLIYTGMRRGELMGLKWQDIEPERNLLHVRRQALYLPGEGVNEADLKTESSNRAIVYPPMIANQLNDYRKWWLQQKILHGDRWRGEANRIFIQPDGTPLNPDTINFWVKKFIQKNNLPHFTPHSLRHTFATLQIAAGVDYRTVQALTGHAQASTLLNTYSHAIKSAKAAAIDKLDHILAAR